LIAVLVAAPVLVHPPGIVASERGEAAAEADAAEYRAHFRGVLESALGESAPSLRAAERHFESLKSMRPGDPRVESGYGLVLMKLHKHCEGVAHIETAAAADPPLLPAHRALIRETIRQGDSSRALKQLVALAEQIGTPDRRSDPASQDMARWSG